MKNSKCQTFLKLKYYDENLQLNMQIRHFKIFYINVKRKTFDILHKGIICLGHFLTSFFVNLNYRLICYRKIRAQKTTVGHKFS